MLLPVALERHDSGVSEAARRKSVAHETCIVFLGWLHSVEITYQVTRFQTSKLRAHHTGRSNWRTGSRAKNATVEAISIAF